MMNDWIVIPKTIMRVYKSSFEAAHIIEGHPKCGVKHGHSYNLTVNIVGEDDKWIDFADIKERVDDYVQKQLDHQDLGNASAEQISAMIAKTLFLQGYHGNIELFETSKFGVTRQF